MGAPYRALALAAAVAPPRVAPPAWWRRALCRVFGHRRKAEHAWVIDRGDGCLDAEWCVWCTRCGRVLGTGRYFQRSLGPGPGGPTWDEGTGG